MKVREFCEYAAGLDKTVSLWKGLVSTKLFMFLKLFGVMVFCSFIIDGLNWLKAEYNIADWIYLVLFLVLFMPSFLILGFRSFTGTLFYSPARKVFFARRLALLASVIMPHDADIMFRDRRKRFEARDLSGLARLIRRRSALWLAGTTLSGKRVKAWYGMTFFPQGGRIVAGTPLGSGGGDKMYFWEILCDSGLPDCEGTFDYLRGKKIVVDNISREPFSRQKCNSVKRGLGNISGTGARGYFTVSEHRLALTVYDNVRKIRPLPYGEFFTVEDDSYAVKRLSELLDILSGKHLN
jgi:hypothetical protein